MLDSTKAVTQNQASLHQNTQTVRKEKKATRMPWYSYTLLLVFLLLFLYLRFRNKIKEFLKL
jgi:type VI protein secretion system component VasF